MDPENTNTTLAAGVESSSHGDSVDDAFYFIRLLFGIFGLAGNSLVLVVMIRVPSLRSITNLFITNQSIIDLVSSVFLIVYLYDPGRSDYSELGYSAWSAFLCLVWHSHYIFWAMLGCSTSNLIILTLERYVSVVHPIIYRNRVTWKTATVFAILPWVTGFVFESYWPAVHVIVGSACYPDFRNQTIQSILGVFIFVVKMFGPVMIMSAVYSTIFRRLKFRRSRVDPDTVRENRPRPQDSRLRPQESRVALTNRHSASLTDAPCTSTVESAFNANGPIVITQTKNVPFTALHRPDRDAVNVTQPDPPNLLRSRVRLNILKTLFVVTVVFTICWTPTSIFFLLYNLGFPFDIPNGTPYKVFSAIVFVNIWINPVVYTFQYRRFQNGPRKTFNCFKYRPRREAS